MQKDDKPFRMTYRASKNDIPKPPPPIDRFDFFPPSTHRKGKRNEQ